MKKESRPYLSDDRDLDGCDNELVCFPGDNGDWYIVIRRIGDRLGKAVRITTSGTPREFEEVPKAVANLYRALGQKN